MTIDQKRKILQRIVVIEADIDALKKARTEIAANGYASATLASGGGSRSYTRLDISKLTEAISALTSELKQLRSMLNEDAQQSLWQTTLVAYS